MTCLVDTLRPEVGRATVAVLERLGVEVEFPREQTCCGQLHWNAGYVAQATALAHRYGEVFGGADVIVSPSGSCAAHVREHVPELAPSSADAAGRTLELSEYLVADHRDVSGVGPGFDGTLTYHPSCHSLRLLGIGDAPERLLRGTSGVDLVSLPDATECCGFGGTFSVKNPAVSGAMLRAKLDAIYATGASAVCACDASCLLHIGGGLARDRSSVRALHLAEVLAG